MALKEENLNLLRENKSARDALSEAKKKLAELEFKTILADIGPCNVKIDADREVLPGYYCPQCKLLLDRGDYSPWRKDTLVCQKCNHIRIQGADADTAKALLVQRIQGKSF